MKQSLEKKLIKFGANNSPTFVAMSIAAAKGIFRPAFTMTDKKENYETKRYTAIREGLTEVIAIPVYYASGLISKFISKKIAIPKNFISKKKYEKYIAGDKSEEIVNAMNHAKNLAEINLEKIQSTSAFAGVCISALFLIPLICSITIKPIMNRIEKRDAQKKKNINNVITKPNKTNLNTFKSLYSSYNSGMKVGGV